MDIGSIPVSPAAGLILTTKQKNKVRLQFCQNVEAGDVSQVARAFSGVILAVGL